MVLPPFSLSAAIAIAVATIAFIYCWRKMSNVAEPSSNGAKVGINEGRPIGSGMTTENQQQQRQPRRETEDPSTSSSSSTLLTPLTPPTPPAPAPTRNAPAKASSYLASLNPFGNAVVTRIRRHFSFSPTSTTSTSTGIGTDTPSRQDYTNRLERPSPAVGSSSGFGSSDVGKAVTGNRNRGNDDYSYSRNNSNSNNNNNSTSSNDSGSGNSNSSNNRNFRNTATATGRFNFFRRSDTYPRYATTTTTTAMASNPSTSPISNSNSSSGGGGGYQRSNLSSPPPNLRTVSSPLLQPPPLTPVTLKDTGSLVPSDVLLTSALAEEIRLLIPPRLQLMDTWRLVYSLARDGSSLATLYHKAADVARRSLRAGYVLVVRDSSAADVVDADGGGGRCRATSGTPGVVGGGGGGTKAETGGNAGSGRPSTLFGAYLTDPPHPASHFYGTGECFLWKAILPRVRAPKPRVPAQGKLIDDSDDVSPPPIETSTGTDLHSSGQDPVSTQEQGECVTGKRAARQLHS